MVYFRVRSKENVEKKHEKQREIYLKWCGEKFKLISGLEIYIKAEN